jgi:hypothetical protein
MVCGCDSDVRRIFDTFHEARKSQQRVSNDTSPSLCMTFRAYGAQGPLFAKGKKKGVSMRRTGSVARTMGVKNSL